MFQLAIRRGLLERMPLFPNRLEENPPREGFFEHDEYLKVRAHAPASYQDVLDFAYYSGWRRNEIVELTWDEVDLKGGVIRLPARRSKTKTGRMLPISAPLRQVLDRRTRARRPGDRRVFRRDGVTVNFTGENLLRDLAPQVLGAVIRRFGDFSAAEDAVQEALLAAAVQWPEEGVPDNPRGWLIQVAARRMTDHRRTELARRRREAVVVMQMPADQQVAPAADSGAGTEQDDTLILLFMCCHPALTRPSAIALTA